MILFCTRAVPTLTNFLSYEHRNVLYRKSEKFVSLVEMWRCLRKDESCQLVNPSREFSAWILLIFVLHT